jgi:hypothetical protein
MKEKASIQGSMLMGVEEHHQPPRKEARMEQGSKALAEIQQSIVELFWQVKTMGRIAQDNVDGDVSTADTDRAERTIRSRLQEIGRRLIGEYFEAVGTGDMGYRLEWGGECYTRKHRMRENSILTSFGPVTCHRSIYYNANGQSLVPFDRLANLPERNVTYLAQELMARLGMEDTYADSQQFYLDFFGCSVSSRTIEQVVVETGQSCEGFRDHKPDLTDEPSGRIGVVSFDGKGIPVVPADRTTGKTREALLGCVYTIEPQVRDPEALANLFSLPEVLSDEDRRRLQRTHRAENIEYFATLASPKEHLFADVKVAAETRFETCRPTTVVCLMDGALKLWELAEQYFPDAVHVLDLMHVLGYLRAAVAAQHRDDEKANALLLSAYLDWLLKGKVDSVIKSLRIRLAKNRWRGKRRKDVQAAITYFHNHRAYMRYDQYLTAGYPVATGVIESACKHIAKTRMDRAGAQWRIDGAEPVLKLRCIKASGHWRHFCEIRKQTERKRLYPSVLKQAA